jgi:hypothetical protein
MIGLLILLGYLAGVVVGWWVLTPVLIDSVTYGNDEPTVGDRVFGSFTALAISLAWPIALPVYFMAIGRGKTPKELRREAEAREFRIRQLERELGVTR